MRYLILFISLLFLSITASAGNLINSFNFASSSSYTVSYVGVEETTYAGSNQNCTVDVPSGAVEGDMVIGTNITDVGSQTLYTPVDWDQLGNVNGTNNYQAEVYYRILPASPPASYTFTSNGSTVGRSCSMVAFSKSGGTWVIPPNNSEKDTTTAGATITGNSVTGLADGALFVAVFNDSGYTVSSGPADMTSRHYWGQESTSTAVYTMTGTTAIGYTKSLTWSGSDSTGMIQVAIGAE